MLSPQDVALYGTLASLASLDRAELRARCLDSLPFRELLETVPEARGKAAQRAFVFRGGGRCREGGGCLSL